MEDLLKKSVRLDVILVFVIAAALTVGHKFRFASGILISAAWSITNFILLMKILEIALLHKSRKKLSLILVAKFPVLYLIGFWILSSKLFPVYSLLAGLGSILLAVGVVGIWPKHT